MWVVNYSQRRRTYRRGGISMLRIVGESFTSIMLTQSSPRWKVLSYLILDEQLYYTNQAVNYTLFHARRTSHRAARVYHRCANHWPWSPACPTHRRLYGSRIAHVSNECARTRMKISCINACVVSFVVCSRSETRKSELAAIFKRYPKHIFNRLTAKI